MNAHPIFSRMEDASCLLMQGSYKSSFCMLKIRIADAARLLLALNAES